MYKYIDSWESLMVIKKDMETTSTCLVHFGPYWSRHRFVGMPAIFLLVSNYQDDLYGAVQKFLRSALQVRNRRS